MRGFRTPHTMQSGTSSLRVVRFTAWFARRLPESRSLACSSGMMPGEERGILFSWAGIPETVNPRGPQDAVVG